MNRHKYSPDFDLVEIPGNSKCLLCLMVAMAPVLYERLWVEKASHI